MAHILLVEDNHDLWHTTSEYLDIIGHHVTRCQTGTDGLQQSYTMRYDCILLDVMLPEMDGFSVLKEIRKRSQVPVLMLTAKGEIDDKKTGFTHGADDYLVKPFDLQELSWRIDALIKRTQTSDTIVRRTIQIILDENEVTNNGTPVHLTQTEFTILALIVDKNGQTVTKSHLVEELWWGDALREHSNKLDVHIHNIRKKLDKELIVSVPGVGFKMGAI